MTIIDIKKLASIIKELKNDNLIDGTFELSEAIAEGFNFTKYEIKEFSAILNTEV